MWLLTDALKVSIKMNLDYNQSQRTNQNTIPKKGIYFQLQLTLGLDLASFFVFCGVSESESSSESVSELEELSGEELLSWLPGPLSFSSEAL